MKLDRVSEIIPFGPFVLSLYPFILISAVQLDSLPSFNLRIVVHIFLAAIYNIAFFCLLLALINRLSPSLIRSFAAAPLWLILAVFTFISIYHFCLYKQFVSLPSVYALIDTNRKESLEFVQSYFRFDFLALAVLASAPSIYSFKYSFSNTLPSRKSFLTTLIIVGIFFPVSYVGFQRPYLYNSNPFLFFPYTVTEALHEKQQILDLYANMNKTFPPVAQSQSSEPAIHVLVVGEATTRRHMSLYGYNRPTSPNLIRLRPSIFLADDACSSRGSTIPQLQELFTFANRDDRSPLFKAPNLLQIMKAAGFKTFWISNQPHSQYDNWSGILSGSADVRVFLNKADWSDLDDWLSFDEKIFKPFAAALADPAVRKFIVLHLMGTHANYEYRYPRRFTKFVTMDGINPQVLANNSIDLQSLRSDTRPGLLDAVFNSIFNNSPLKNSPFTEYNAYDNAVLYNDFIVSELMKAVIQQNHVTLTYIPDHGEAVYESRFGFVGHIDGPAPRQVYEVPLLFYFSPDIKRQLAMASPPRLEIFKRNLKKPFQSDHLIHTLLDLYKVDNPNVRKSGSLFDESFALGPRFCDSRVVMDLTR
jgi:heptose-I-phosphate ethanolaminephosphotransferase